ncbi:restriction endonuclease subunit S [Mammaliicoccus vitulinus]
MEFNSYKLRNVLMEKGYIRGPFGSALKRSELLQEGVPVYEQKNAIYNVRTFRYFVSKEKYEELKRFTVKPYDLLISCSGTVGRTSIITPKDPKGIISQALLILRTDVNIINPYYLYYFFQSKKGHNELINRSSGSVQVNIAKRKIIENISIDLPSISNQKKIVDFLSSLDNKINSNKNIIANLEELSQTLFKRWFVDFEFPDENGNPYKSSGGELIDSELGEIPSGWKIVELKEVTEIIMGQSPKSDTYNTENEGIPLLNGATDFKNRNIKPTKYTTDPKKIGQLGDFVFGVRATVGLVTELDRDYAIGRGAGIARINTTHKEWLYEILVKAFQYFENSISGSVYINVSSNDLKNSKVIYPSKEILDAYHKNLVSNFELVKSMKMQIKHLTELRDTLLPKLMSGELEIPDDIEVNEDELSI